MEEDLARAQNQYPSFSDKQNVFNRKQQFRRRRSFEVGLRRIRKRDFEVISIVRTYLDEGEFGLGERVLAMSDVVLSYEDCQKHADWYTQKRLIDHPKYHNVLKTLLDLENDYAQAIEDRDLDTKIKYILKMLNVLA